jgi:hypothetical protein
MTLVEIVTALVALGAGIGGGVAGMAVSRGKKRRSDAPPPHPIPEPLATQTGRFEVPFVTREECHVRESAFDARLGRMETKLDAYGGALSENGRALARIEGRLERGQR